MVIKNIEVKETEMLVFVTVEVESIDLHKQAKGYGSSKYRGVFWVKSEKRWRAQFSHKGKRHTIGRFECEIEAAKAYDEKAFSSMGELAYLNFPENYFTKGAKH